ncbi:MAG: hypothetical protein COA62_06070 [Rhodobiaceae bacterium]|nr:MAG: hypothetical protein COA62_06070 [Rhodobiaceae bacterium]
MARLWGKADDADSARRRWVHAAFDADPYLLPASIALSFDPLWRRACGFIRYVTIYKDKVSVQDSSPPFGVWDWEEQVSAYQGVVLCVAYKDRSMDEPVILIELSHDDPEKSIVVHASFDGADSGARWRSWAAQLGLPLLVQDRRGNIREANDRVGAVTALPAQPHRGASVLTTRRPLSFGYTGRPRQWSDRVTSATRPQAY